ncbi:AAEL007319-PA [Aedes aegypti]|uniref:AAEL007319-PA n=1 Tax=Aedes aegypti TaxID=7159 RepID=Q172P6_AEDAE|nr:AAEL007319-PA [Aedes aegypti]
MISYEETSGNFFRTASFLLSPHVPGDKDSGKDNSDNQNIVNSGDSVELEPSVFDFDSESDDLLKYYKTPMQFGTENSTIITSQVGSTAHIPCRIHHIGECVIL